MLPTLLKALLLLLLLLFASPGRFGVESSCVLSGVSCVLSAEAIRCLFSSSDMDDVGSGSITGQTNPVRGVNAGRCVLRVSREDCSENNDVNWLGRVSLGASRRKKERGRRYQTVRQDGIQVRGLVDTVVHDEISRYRPD